MHVKRPFSQNRVVDLVIGGAGFVGSNLTRELLQRNRAVVCVDNDASKRIHVEKKRHQGNRNYRLFAADINNEKTLKKLQKLLNGQTVNLWHLAANSDIQSGAAQPWIDEELTFRTTTSILKLSSSIDTKSISFASTSAVYGESGSSKKRFTEDDSTKPISYYGICKRASEEAIILYSQYQKIPARIFRFANVVGSPATHGLISDLIDRLKQGQYPLQVLGSGGQLRSFLHVEILIGMILDLERAKFEGIINLTPQDEGMTVSQVVDLLLLHFSPRPNVRYQTRQSGWAGDVFQIRMSNQKLLGITGRPVPFSHDSCHKAIHDVLKEKKVEYLCRDGQNL